MKIRQITKFLPILLLFSFVGSNAIEDNLWIGSYAIIGYEEEGDNHTKSGLDIPVIIDYKKDTMIFTQFIGDQEPMNQTLKFPISKSGNVIFTNGQQKRIQEFINYGDSLSLIDVTKEHRKEKYLFNKVFPYKLGSKKDSLKKVITNSSFNYQRSDSEFEYHFLSDSKGFYKQVNSETKREMIWKLIDFKEELFLLLGEPNNHRSTIFQIKKFSENEVKIILNHKKREEIIVNKF